MPETQQSIGAWAKETFTGGDDLSPRHVLRLLEEVIEACDAVGATWNEILSTVLSGRPANQRSGSLYPKPKKIAEELADCSIVLAVIAARRGVDLQAEVDAKMATNRSRSWISNGDGTGYHTKEEAS